MPIMRNTRATIKPRLPRKAGLLIWDVEDAARYHPSELPEAKSELEKYIIHLMGKIKRRDMTIRTLKGERNQ